MPSSFSLFLQRSLYKALNFGLDNSTAESTGGGIVVVVGMVLSNDYWKPVCFSRVYTKSFQGRGTPRWPLLDIDLFTNIYSQRQGGEGNFHFSIVHTMRQTVQSQMSHGPTINHFQHVSCITKPSYSFVVSLRESNSLCNNERSQRVQLT